MAEKDGYKIAVASEDGVMITFHFGKALKFNIYEYDGNNERVGLTVRDLSEAAKEDDSDDEKLKDAEEEYDEYQCQSGRRCKGRLKTIELLSDCDYVLAGRMGEKVQRNFEKAGVTPLEARGEIEPALERLNKYIAGGIIRFL